MSDRIVKIEDVNPEHRFAPEMSRGVRAATTTISSWNEDERTFEFVLATPAPVLRWYRDLDTYERFQAEEVLPIETAVLMSESGRNVPILDSHYAYSISAVVGTCIEMRRENGQIVAKGRLSSMESCKDVVVGVREGVLNNISAGYAECDFELVTDPATGKRTMRAKRWVIYEASLVPVPADGNAKTRSAHDLVTDWRAAKSQETEMTKEEIQALVAEGVRAAMAAQTKTQATDVEAAARAAIETGGTRAPAPATQPTTPAAPATQQAAGGRSAEETASIAQFRSAAESAGCAADYDAFVAAGASMTELRSLVMDAKSKRSAPNEITTDHSGGRADQGDRLLRFNETAIGREAAGANRR